VINIGGIGIEQLGAIAAFVVTLMVFSYVLGDNLLYRLAVYVFVGLSAAFIAIVTWENVVVPWLTQTIVDGLDRGDIPSAVLGLIPLLLAVLLLFKTSPRIGGFGNIALAFIVAVGTAVAVAGALTGTLIPLAMSTGAGSDPGDTLGAVNLIVMFVGVICSLLYFQYLARRTPTGEIRRGLAVRSLSVIGHVFIVVTLGALYAAAILSSLTVFTERLSFLLNGG
jgi:hypothetical protein